MPKILQRALLIGAVIALLVLGTEIVLSLKATTHGNTPVRVVHVTAGPYPLTISLYDDPANAGFSLPFAITPEQAVKGPLVFDVSSIPGAGVSATPVRASITPDANAPDGVQGTAEITVQGPWDLHIAVSGPAGHGEAYVPIQAVAPPAIPEWLGWILGFIPLAGLLIFLLALRRRLEAQERVLTAK